MTDPIPLAGNLALELTPEQTRRLRNILIEWGESDYVDHAEAEEHAAIARDLLQLIEGDDRGD